MNYLKTFVPSLALAATGMAHAATDYPITMAEKQIAREGVCHGYGYATNTKTEKEFCEGFLKGVSSVPLGFVPTPAITNGIVSNVCNNRFPDYKDQDKNAKCQRNLIGLYQENPPPFVDKNISPAERAITMAFREPPPGELDKPASAFAICQINNVPGTSAQALQDCAQYGKTWRNITLNDAERAAAIHGICAARHPKASTDLHTACTFSMLARLKPTMINDVEGFNASAAQALVAARKPDDPYAPAKGCATGMAVQAGYHTLVNLAALGADVVFTAGGMPTFGAFSAMATAYSAATIAPDLAYGCAKGVVGRTVKDAIFQSHVKTLPPKLVTPPPAP